VLGQLCSIGGYQAVAEMFGMRVSGIVAWFLWRGVYLFKLPTWSRRIKVGLDWFWDLLFPRDLSFNHARPGHNLVTGGPKQDGSPTCRHYTRGENRESRGAKNHADGSS
jgi:hypothetical protein